MRLKDSIKFADSEAIHSIVESGDYPKDATHIGFVSERDAERVIFYRQNRENGHWSYLISNKDDPSNTIWLECLNRPNTKVVRLYNF